MAIIPLLVFETHNINRFKIPHQHAWHHLQCLLGVLRRLHRFSGDRGRFSFFGFSTAAVLITTLSLVLRWTAQNLSVEIANSATVRHIVYIYFIGTYTYPGRLQ